MLPQVEWILNALHFDLPCPMLSEIGRSPSEEFCPALAASPWTWPTRNHPPGPPGPRSVLFSRLELERDLCGATSHFNDAQGFLVKGLKKRQHGSHGTKGFTVSALDLQRQNLWKWMESDYSILLCLWEVLTVTSKRIILNPDSDSGSFLAEVQKCHGDSWQQSRPIQLLLSPW